jgi:hypothetical protein
VRENEAVENALLALDGAINTLVMARIILEQAVEKAGDKRPAFEDGKCNHLNTIPLVTASNPSGLMCNDCGETL